MRLTAVLAETSDIAWDIICFSETRAADADATLAGGHRLICCSDSLKHAGVAVLVPLRHSEDIKAVVTVSGRLIYIDVIVQNSIWRFVAVYFSHAGYPRKDFEDLCKPLRICLADADLKGIRCIVGGDFNTSLRTGYRGIALDELAHEFGLEICNRYGNCTCDYAWTFKSALGVKRRIDFILVDSSLRSHDSRAVDALDLGSDHRAVRTSIDYPTCYRPKRHRCNTRRRIDWEQYAAAVKQCSSRSDVEEMGLDEVEEVLHRAADVVQNVHRGEESTKPWQSRYFQNLRRERAMH